MSVVDFTKFKSALTNQSYKDKISKMDRLELVSEVVVFNEERFENQGLNKDLIVKGLILFGELGTRAETANFKEFSRTYCKHLEVELNQLKKQYV